MNATAPQIATELPTTTPPSATILDFPTNGDPASSPTRKGKIARLPADIREQVNELLRGGRTYCQVVAQLEKLDYPGITPRNVCNWKHGGHVDWLREQQEAEARLALPKALERCVRSGEIDRLQQNAMILAADHLMTIMGLFNPKSAVDLLYQKPELFPRYVAALGSLARCSSDLAKAFDIAHNRETAIRSQLPALTQPPTPTDDEPAASDRDCPHSQQHQPAETAPNTLDQTSRVDPHDSIAAPPNPPPLKQPTPNSEPPRKLNLEKIHAALNNLTNPIPGSFQIPDLSLERATADLLHLLSKPQNGNHRKATEANGNHRKLPVS